MKTLKEKIMTAARHSGMSMRLLKMIENFECNCYDEDHFAEGVAEHHTDCDCNCVFCVDCRITENTRTVLFEKHSQVIEMEGKCK